MLRGAFFHEGHEHDHDDFSPEHDGGGGESLAWALDNVDLTTVGVDVGSSTSHLLFAHLHLQRLTQSLSSRFVVVEREVLHRSPILLTPYRADGLIDVDELQRFVDQAYTDAGLRPEDVDTGAVILTGAALERANARNVAELFASHGGKFVCASAGHNLEGILAAHGSGAVALSRQCHQTLLHVDVGGGTTKLGLLRNGEIVRTAAVHVGGRLVAFDPDGRVNRIEPSAELVAHALNIPLRLGEPLSAGDRQRMAEALAEVLMEHVRGGSLTPLAQSFLLTEPLNIDGIAPSGVTFSGGVSEYIYGRESTSYGDLGGALAAALKRSEWPAEAVPLNEGIRATVLGASQFSVQVSGQTVHISDPAVLPLRNLPVVHARLVEVNPPSDAVAAAILDAFRRMDLQPGVAPAAIMLPWQGEPHYAHLRSLADGIAAAVPDMTRPLVVATDGDIAKSLGGILAEEIGIRAPLIVVDGLQLLELDYVDLGEVLQPANVVPVVVKSLAFGGSA